MGHQTTHDQYRQIIVCFLEINPEPSDDQVHQFAASLGVDKEELESIFYEMLAECIDCDEEISPDRVEDLELQDMVVPASVVVALCVYAANKKEDVVARLERDALVHALAEDAVMQAGAVLALTEDERVLQDDYDPNTVRTELLLLNDDGPSREQVEELQQMLERDGTVEDVETQAVQDALYTDGVEIPSL